MMISAMKVTVERIRPTDKMVSGKMKCSSLRGSSGSSSSSSSLNRNSFISKPAWNEVGQVLRLLNIFHLLKPHHMNVELLLKPPLLIDHEGVKITVWFLHSIFAAVPPAQPKFIVTQLRMHHDSFAISNYPFFNQIIKFFI